jgi:single-strand DNA-binding protein
MADINHVVLVGRLTRDAELKYITTGTAVSKFGIAINRRKKVNEEWVEEAHFFNIVLWGKIAESLNPYLKKGKQVGIEGELRQNRWEQDGQPRSRIEIVANNIQLLGGKVAVTESQEGIQQENQSMENSNYDDDFKDDIPF